MRTEQDDDLQRAERIERLCAAIWARQPSARCLAYLQVRSGGRVRDLILGQGSLLGSDVALIDWERAPLARVFLGHAVDDEYELELEDGRVVEGTVLARAVLRCSEAQSGIQRVDSIDAIDDGITSLRCSSDSAIWTVAPTLDRVRITPREPSERAGSSPIMVVLDAAQRHAVELESNRSLLVLGEAGFGKTTVALHRVAHLSAQARADKREFAGLVLVPTRGLVRLVVALLDRLGLGSGSVEVRTFNAWIAKQGRRVFTDLPKRDSEAAPIAVARVKRHPAVREVLPEIIAGTAAMREVEAGYLDDERRRTQDQLLHLFGDRALLERVAAASNGALTPRMLDQVIAHTRVQFSPTTEHALADVDADRLQTTDGLAIDAGTPLHDAETIDVEDFAVLFELDHLRSRSTGSTGSTESTESRARYDHIVVDEAQEFAPIELAVIGRARKPDGSITIAGDEHQQVDETVAFTTWPGVIAELGVADTCERVTLHESYRCPPSIEAFARALFGRLDQLDHPDQPVATDDPALQISVVAHELELVTVLIASLLEIRAHDRLASVAVVCRFASSARRMFGSIHQAIDCRLVIDGDFRFGPGISVTCVDEIKGLEFDYVIVPDATAANYPDSGEARRALYVASTRALARLWLLASGRASPLLRAQIDGG